MLRNIPLGTQPGTATRLADKGLPRFDGRGRGDLNVNIAVRIPDQVSDADRRLWERLRKPPHR